MSRKKKHTITTTASKTTAKGTQISRYRAEQADIVMQFVQQSDNAFNSWYHSSIRDNYYKMICINGTMSTYHHLRTSLFLLRTFPSAQRDMATINIFLENVLDA